MRGSLHGGDNIRQRTGDYRSSGGLRCVMGTKKEEPAHTPEEKKAFGRRLAKIRDEAGFTIQSAADALTKAGSPLTKQGIGHWETGRNLPDALWLHKLARLYGVPVDALYADATVSVREIQLAKDFRDAVLHDNALNESSIGSLTEKPAPKRRGKRKK